jgi:hypothetical protein
MECRVVDESHFHVIILLCQQCSQRFVSVFAETIDWLDGEDPQFWTLLPITGDEAVVVMQSYGNVETVLSTLGKNRRSLRHDFPKGEDAKNYWSFGIPADPHD